MGVFSWKCAKSGIEIVNNMVPHMPDWLSEVVVMIPGHPPVHGSYDGYGRLHTDDCDVFDFWEELLEGPEGEPYRKAKAAWWAAAEAEFKRVGVEFGYWEKFREAGGVRPPEHGVPQPSPCIVLQRFYEGELYGDLPLSEGAENQGHFLPPNYPQIAEQQAQEYLAHA